MFTFQRFFLIFFLIVAFVFPGCGIKEKGIEEITLTLAGEGSRESIEARKKALVIFQKDYPHITIKRLEYPGLYYPKIMTMIAGGTPPDVMWLGQGFNEFASRGVLLNLGPFLREDKTFDIQSYHPEVLNWYRYKGELYGLPYGMDLACLVYNKDLFAQESLPHPDATWTWDKLVEVAKKLTKDKDEDGRIDQYGFYMGDNQYMGAFGGSLLNEDNTKCLLDQPGAIRALQFFVDMVKKEKICLSPVGGLVSSIGALEYFMAGQIGMLYTHTWNFPKLRGIKKFRWDIALLPKQVKREHWASSGGFAISKDTKHPKEAWLLFKFLSGPKYQELLATVSLPAIDTVAKEVAKSFPPPPEHYYLSLFP